MAGITIEATGAQSVLDALGKLIGRAGNLHPLMQDIGQTMERNVQLRFDLKVDPTGKPWAPHKPATTARYAKADTGKDGEHRRQGTLLERSGDMRKSTGFDAGNDYVYIGFGKPYAEYHEFGTERMDRRGLLTADPESGTLGAGDERDILGLIEGYFGK